MLSLCVCKMKPIVVDESLLWWLHVYSGEEAHNRVQHSQFQNQSTFKVPKLIANGVPKHTCKLEVRIINL